MKVTLRGVRDKRLFGFVLLVDSQDLTSERKNLPGDSIPSGCSRRTCILMCSHSDRGFVPSAVVVMDRRSQNSPLPL